MLHVKSAVEFAGIVVRRANPGAISNPTCIQRGLYTSDMGYLLGIALGSPPDGQSAV